MDTLLRRIRERKQESTYTVAEALEIDQGAYYRIEMGERSVSPELARKIAKHFEVPLDMICSPSRYMVAAVSEEELAQKAS